MTYAEMGHLVSGSAVHVCTSFSLPCCILCVLVATEYLNVSWIGFNFCAFHPNLIPVLLHAQTHRKETDIISIFFISLLCVAAHAQTCEEEIKDVSSSAFIHFSFSVLLHAQTCEKEIKDMSSFISSCLAPQ